MDETTANDKKYQERMKRIMDAVALKKPDRVPIATIADFYFASCQGVSCKDAMYDYDKLAEAYKATARKYDWDMYGQPAALFPGPVMDLMDISGFSWPGAADDSNRLPENFQYQFQEKEILMSDEIDDFLKDTTDFSIRKLMPRMSGTLANLSMIPVFIKSMAMPYSLIHLLPLISLFLDELGTKLKKAGEEMVRWQSAQDALAADLKSMGYPITYSFMIICAFDWVADFLRGMKGTMLDMYRQPDKLKALVDVFEPAVIEFVDVAVEMYQVDRVCIPLHWGAAGFMSDQQFRDFYWPQLKRLFLYLIERDILPMPLYEGDYTPRLECLAELPPGKMLGHYDTVDRKKHREVLGSTTCFWGDVPKSLLIAGTTEQVRDYVKELIDDFPDGGLIIDGDTSGIPAESRIENVMAMTETVHTYRKY